MKQQCVITLIALGFAAGAAWAEKVVEKYPDGKIKSEYVTDAEGRKHGPFREFHPTGRPARQGRYVEDKLHGPVVRFNDKGRKESEQVWAEGVLLIPRSRTEMVGALRKIGQTHIKAPRSAQSEARSASDSLRRLMMYRYLCGAPHADMELDDDLTKQAIAAALVCHKLGEMTHHPSRNPGLPDDMYQLGKKGAAKSNLSWGTSVAGGGVDSFMDDSDERNIDRIGHRRWCLNPKMLKTGFGRAGEYGAMYAHDKSRNTVPDWDMITFPARGYMPSEFFGGHYAWSVSLNPRHYAKPSGKAVKVTVWKVSNPGLSIARLTAGAPMKLNYFNVDNRRFGVDNCIIFRPEGVGARTGERYFVQIDGVKTTGGDAIVIRYYVEFT